MKRAFAAIAITTLCLGGLTACSEGADDAKASKTPTAPKPPANKPADSGIPPKPSTSVASKYISQLTAIDPDIVHGDPEKAIDRGRNQCSSIKGGQKRAKIVELTNMRFTSPDHPDGFGAATAEKILDVVHRNLCPDF